MTESCRLITTEQYQEYLKLKEEHKPLSWDELKEEAKKMGADVEVFDGFICLGCMYFWNDGEINYNGEIIAEDRTPSQMLAIMKALQ